MEFIYFLICCGVFTIVTDIYTIIKSKQLADR